MNISIYNLYKRKSLLQSYAVGFVVVCHRYHAVFKGLGTPGNTDKIL